MFIFTIKKIKPLENMSKRNFNRHINQQIQMASSSTMALKPQLCNVSPVIPKEKSLSIQSSSIIGEQSEDLVDIPLVCNIPYTNFTEKLEKDSNRETSYKAANFNSSVRRSEFLVSLEIVANLFACIKENANLRLFVAAQ
ncbi:hypothetical protein ACI65C_013794 [Semiaphis heraclei]